MALVIYNPISGDSTAKSFFNDHVIPLLNQNGVHIARVLETHRVDDAGSAALEHFFGSDGPSVIICGAGDGTLHEIITAISLAPESASKSSQNPSKVSFVLVPCGTANALYSTLFPPTQEEDPIAYKLKGIHAFINKSKFVPLTLAITSIHSPPAARVPAKNAVSVVVTSTALHASILHDSEALRAQIPSIDRFKVAAHNNSTRWYNSYVKLLPSQSTGLVELYDPSLGKFVPHENSSHDDPFVELNGPFGYFLSTVNVDRLEPAYRIAPLMSSLPSTGAYMDVVIIRPLRDPSVQSDSPETRAAFAQKGGLFLMAPYRNGNHINLRYNQTGDVVSEGEGLSVVEYFRCGGWEWEPDDQDDAAHLICTDGLIQTIPRSGKAVCTAAVPDPKAGFVVYL